MCLLMFFDISKERTEDGMNESKVRQEQLQEGNKPFEFGAV